MPSLRQERLPSGERMGGKRVAVSPAFGLPPMEYWHPDTPAKVRAAFEAMRQEQAESVRGSAPAAHAQPEGHATAIPDLRNVSLAELGDTVLAHSVELYRERLKENGVPLSSFNARI